MPRLVAFVLGMILALPAAAQGSGEKGKAAYVKHGCWQCHGFDGAGSISGSRLSHTPMPLEAFSVFVRNTNGSMPPYQKAILSEEDLADIHAYLRSLPKSPDADRIPLLRR